MDAIERISQGLEIRAEGRNLEGYALRWGERSPTHNERFESGALQPVGDYWLNWAHDPERVIAYRGGGLVLSADDEGVSVRAALPRTRLGDRALDAVRTGRMTGLSVEFVPKAERREADTRVILSAELSGVGLVRNPSYTGSRVEARAAIETRARGVKASIPYKRKLDCRCHKGACDTVQFDEGAFDESIEGGKVLAVISDYSGAVASQAKGSLNLTSTKAGLQVDIARLPDTQPVRDLIELSQSVPVIARPVYRAEDPSDFVEAGDVATYKRATLRAILLGSTDRLAGFDEIDLPEVRTASRAKRRAWL